MNFLPTALRYTGGAVVYYGALQLLVGVQVGVIAAALHLAMGMAVPAAIAAAMPIGLPLLIVQGALGVLWWRSRQPAPVRAPAAPVTAAATD